MENDATTPLTPKLYNKLFEKYEALKAQLATVEGEREKALEAVYIPGSWACTQCEFGQVITNLYVNSGTVGPNTDEVPICPNDGSLMRRSTWKERVMSDDKYITDKLNEIDVLKATIARLEQETRGQRNVLQLVSYMVHYDGEFDDPALIAREAEQHGLEGLLALRAAHAALEWPHATGGDKEGGWTVSPSYLRTIQETYAGDEAVSWEQIEAVLLAQQAIARRPA